ncbi:SR-related and CTD-associated factor 4b isoform X2 [Triplophysa dalaica]|uniref:SR-related and CTD-associated factor 4b isoform X2 n=1 Tax=Triplophysa dalaica TaxID=1582913 RepID=UPI0024DF92B5|nr:SR-related and CTD-associated factor 4b isoform X2 [Triplophysa dalaica]
MDMDAVNAFNEEMLSMMDMPPPISRAKMMSVTKAGIKAIKLYKHAVQIVEKFIKRCKPDLKVAGLYVVDSIIRQSRHQFGADKDVFGPRFLKNFSVTFQNLYECPVDDKEKILRVLNLWQKNDVFGMDIIQPLLDMAAAPVLPVFENGTTVGVSLATPMSVPQLSSASASAVTLPSLQNPVSPPTLPNPVAPPHLQNFIAPPSFQNPGALAAVAQLLQGTQGLEQLLQSLQQSGGAGLSQSTAPPTEQKTSLAKSLLDRFDYDDDPEPVEENPEPAYAAPHALNLTLELQQALQAHLLSHLANQSQVQEQVAHQSLAAMVQNQIPDNTLQNTVHTMDESSIPPSFHQSHVQNRFQTTPLPEESAVKMDHSADDRDRRHRRSRSRSPQRSSTSRSRRSRSGSRSHRERYHPTRSRSKERQARSEERREREKERERRQKGLPSIRKEHVSVCSTTLWIGQLDKKTQKQDIMSLMEEFGQVESINMIPPRGCAYVVMVHRQDAHTALNKLNRGTVKVNQKSIKIAWALNKGIKSEFKKFWDVERGVTYIPWNKVKPDDIQSYRGGGMLDTETLKPEWNISTANPAVPVTGGPEGGHGNRASLIKSPTVHPVASGNVPPGPPPNMSLPPPAMTTGGPLLAFPPPGFNPAKMPAGFPPAGPVSRMNTAGPPSSITENPVLYPSKHPLEGRMAHTDLTGGPQLSPSRSLLGHGPLLPHPQLGPRPPFMPPFPNDMPRPNMPSPNVPPQMMPPRGPNPMYGERPAGRFRMPAVTPPVNDFPPPREGFPPRGPPRGPRPVDRWDEEPNWNNRRDHGPENGPERFEPPFHRGGWGRGGHRGRGRFGN